MIHITGDIHGDIQGRINNELMPGEKDWGKDDKLIVLGDFGLIFFPKMERFAHELECEKDDFEYLEQKEHEILFIDVNHENFDRLFAESKEEERYGGIVRRLGKNIFWLQRGQIYKIENKTFFCMGGAYSIDKSRRIEGMSWWKEEYPTKKEMDFAAENLRSHGMKVDYILSHTCPYSFISIMGFVADPHDIALTSFFDWVWDEVEFKHWYFGHWHIDRPLHSKVTAMFKNTIDLP